MLYKDGDILWCTPIRYWETQEPTRCTVIGDQKVEVHAADELNGNRHLYVHSDEYGHPVYVTANKLWYDKDTAIRAALLRKWLFNMRHSEEAHVVCERMFAEEQT